MIISKTPLRMSFFGGGTDMGYFYRNFGGNVLSLTINRYVFVTIHSRFEKNFRISYSSQETPSKISDIRHPIVREALSMFPSGGSLEINSIAEIPSSGSGLGSSSAFTVGLLNSLLYKMKIEKSQERLAQLACQIEITSLGSPIGKQDQYAAAYGGFNLMTFHEDEKVSIERVSISDISMSSFFGNFQLFFTDLTRDANLILASQKNSFKSNDEVVKNLKIIKSQVHEGRALIELGKFDDFGMLLHEGWVIKRKLTSGVSNNLIDDMYEKARSAGAIGGKLLGAGGGGFLLVYSDKKNHANITESLKPWREISIDYEPIGSQIFDIGGGD